MTDELSASDLARLLAAQRKERRKHCAREGCANILTTKGRGLYCSRACQQAEYRRRVAAGEVKPRKQP